MLGKIIGEGRTATIYNYEDNKAVKLFKAGFEHLLAPEIKYNKMVYSQGLPSPNVYGEIEIDRRKGIVYEKLTGLNMADTLKSNPFIAKKLGTEAGRIHANINSAEAKDLPSQNDVFSNMISKSKHLSEDAKKKIIEYVKTLPDTNRLCHGDLHIENYIVQDDKTYVIDWLTAYSGHPAGDVARTLIIMNSPDVTKPYNIFLRPIIGMIIGSYNKAFINTYLQLSDIDRDLIGKFMLPAAAIRLNEEIPYEKEWLMEIVDSFLGELSDCSLDERLN